MPDDQPPVPPVSPLPLLPPRPSHGHKGTFGTVCVLGGQASTPMMVGGPALTALAALRSGCGLAILAMPAPVLVHGIGIAWEATGLPLPVDHEQALRPSDAATVLDEHLSRVTCLAVGPGLGVGEPQRQVVIRLIARDDLPLVVDADALNVLAQTPQFARDWRADAILTPHPGEYRRLATTLGIDADPTDPNDRAEAAEQLAQRLGCVVVLKGRQTIITDGHETFDNTSGNVALASGGTGDVLTGVIAGLVAQFHKAHFGVGLRQVTPEERGGLSLLQCARLAVHLHGLAADHWAQRHGDAGLLARDLLDELPRARRTLRNASA